MNTDRTQSRRRITYVHEHKPLVRDALEDASTEEQGDPEPWLDRSTLATILEVREQVVDTDRSSECPDDLAGGDTSQFIARNGARITYSSD